MGKLIGELAAEVVVHPRTIRYYESLRLLPKPERTKGGYRLYDEEAVRRLTFIGKAKSLGLTLSEIRGILQQHENGNAPLPRRPAPLARPPCPYRPPDRLVNGAEGRTHKHAARRVAVQLRIIYLSQDRTSRELEETMMTRFSLCPACDHCPAVEIDEREVRVGEHASLVRLTPEEWNVLVRAIKNGDLHEIESDVQVHGRGDAAVVPYEEDGSLFAGQMTRSVCDPTW